MRKVTFCVVTFCVNALVEEYHDSLDCDMCDVVTWYTCLCTLFYDEKKVSTLSDIYLCCLHQINWIIYHCLFVVVVYFSINKGFMKLWNHNTMNPLTKIRFKRCVPLVCACVCVCVCVCVCTYTHTNILRRRDHDNRGFHSTCTHCDYFYTCSHAKPVLTC